MQRRGSPLGRTRLGPRAAPMAAEGLALTLPWGRILPPLGAIFCCPAPKGTNPPPTEPQLRMMRGGLVASCAPRETAVAPEVSSAFTPARSGACLTLSCHAGFAGSTQVLRARQQAEESIPAQHCAVNVSDGAVWRDRLDEQATWGSITVSEGLASGWLVHTWSSDDII